MEKSADHTNRRPVFLFFLFIILISFLAILIASYVFAQTSGTVAPGFALSDIHGKKVSLSDFRGKVVILNFWASYCGPCKAEMPSLNKLYLELKNRGLAVIAVSVDPTEAPVLSFASENKLAFPVLMDKNKEIYFDDYASIGLPTTFIINRKGIISEKIIGEQEWDSPEIKGRILNLLGGKP